MYYQITATPTASSDKQAEELTRLLAHSKRMLIQFVTVAGSYKPTRARLTLLTVPDRFADHAARVLALLAGVEAAVHPSAALRPRPEWQHTAVLLPTTPDAPPLDGTLLDGWDSACLALAYRPGRVLARLTCCADDAARVADLVRPGWQIMRPNAVQQLALGSGRAWTGLPSFAPVPGGVVAAVPVPRLTAPADLLSDDPVAALPATAPVLTDDPSGVLLGVAPEGQAVRVARRAMTLAVCGPSDAQQRAVLALLRRGMQAGMGTIAVVDRALLPAEAIRAWEARMRLLDVQNIADSSAVPWRDTAPDLLVQAIGGPTAVLPALPARFGALLDTLGASALRVPAILGLATMPGDNLRGALAAGGMVVVPQDGDTASALIARILLAYLATPPLLGRGLLVLSDPGVVLPDAVRQQAIHVVLGARRDAVLTLHATDAGWSVCTPDGEPCAMLVADLLAQPIEGAGDLVDSIVRDIHGETAAPSPAPPEDAESDATDGWWTAAPRSDDLDAPFDDDAPAAPLLALDEPPVADAAPVTALDSALGQLFAALLDDAPTDPRDVDIRTALAADDAPTAEGIARAWATADPAGAAPWVWRVVLAEADADRMDAAQAALYHAPFGVYAPYVHAVLTAGDQPIPAAPPLRDDAPVPDMAPDLDAVPPTPAAQDAAVLNDATLHAAWQAGASVAQLVTQLVASGMAAPDARVRVRALMRATPAGSSPVVPVVAAAPHTEPLGGVLVDSAAPPAAPLAAPLTTDATWDDAAIWHAWDGGMKMDDLTVAVCGKRGGPKADAARDRIWNVVVVRVLDQLGCDDLADRMAAGESGAADPRYPVLLQRLARSETPPAGSLERSLVKRLLSARQEA